MILYKFLEGLKKHLFVYRIYWAMSNIKIIFFFLILWPCLCQFAPALSPHQDQETSSSIFLINEAIQDVLMNRETCMGNLPDPRGFSDESLSYTLGSSLTDNLLYLYSAQIDDPDLEIEWQKRLLHDSPDPFLKIRLQNNLSSEERRAARRLLRENFYNQLALPLNHTSNAVSDVLQGKLQSLFQLPVDLVYAWYQFGLSSPRERRSEFLLKQFLRKYPAAAEGRQIESLVKRLDEKRNKSLSDQEYRYGRFFLKNHNLQRAFFHLENAAALNPSSHKIEKHLLRVKKEIARDARYDQEFLFVLDGENFFFSEEEKKSYQQLIYGIIKEDWNSLLYETGEFQTRFPQSNYADDAAYAKILGFDTQRNRNDLLQYLETLIEQYPDSNIRRFARMTLQDPSFNPSLQVEEAKRGYHAALERYILFGNRSLDQQAYIASSSAVQYDSFVLENIGIIFLLDVLVRGVKCLVTDPIPQDAVLEAACHYELTCPLDPEIIPIRGMLAKMYADRKQYPRALYYARKAGTFSDGEIRKLSHSHAKHLYRLIIQTSDPQQKIRALSQLVSLFPDAPVTKKARKELEKIIEESSYEYRVSKKELAPYPEIWKGTLELGEALFDAHRRNGEIADRGIQIMRDGSIQYYLEGDTTCHEIPLTEEKKDLFRTQLEILEFWNPAPGAKGEKPKERAFPLELSGAWGPTGFEMYPAFVPLEEDEEGLNLFR